MKVYGLFAIALTALCGIAAADTQITITDAVDLGGWGWAEVTSAAVGPQQNAHCPAGRLFFTDGYTVLATDLDGHPAAFPHPELSPNPRTFTYKETVDPHVIYDNHLVKLKDGSLMLTVEAVTWNDNLKTKPSWWQQTKDYPLKKISQPGGRGIIYVYLSIDCGQSWHPRTSIDAATLKVPEPAGGSTVGLCGTPRLLSETKIVHHQDKSGIGINLPVTTRWSEAGGWDGHYLYADPYQGGLFLSVPCFYGTGKENESRMRALLLRSTDHGGTWNVIGQIDSAKVPVWGWRMPVATDPSGRLAFSYLSAGDLKLAVFSPPYDKVDPLQAQTVTSTSAGDPSAKANINTNIWGSPSLTSGPDGFLIANADWTDDEGAQRQRFRVFGEPSLTQELPSAMAPESPREAMQGTFIDGAPGSRLRAFYWLERAPGLIKANTQSLPDQLRVKFQLFDGKTPLLTHPGELTIKDQKAYAFQPLGLFIGDYMRGDSYVGADGATRFVAVWNERGSLRFNTIKVTQTKTQSAKLSTPVAVTIVPGHVPPLRLALPRIRTEGPKPAAVRKQRP
jgi:hypothetical protein